jgi:hypothetical protein
VTWNNVIIRKSLIFYFQYIVTSFFKARIVESEETDVARELQDKHVSTVTNTHATEKTDESFVF